MSLPLALLALLIERAIGYPQPLYKWLSHPVVWMGNWLGWLEGLLWRPAMARKQGRLRGSFAFALYLGLVFTIALAVSTLVQRLPLSWLWEALLATTLLAQKSLHDHVEAVADGLDQSIGAGREAVSRIVGRDPSTLDESGVSRAALESLAENSSDGVFAPAFWLAIGGLPALALYKAINTADSMIGHKSERYLHFGWAAARVDDWVNYIPARLSGLIFAAAAALTAPARAAAALEAMWRDARKHVSPNAGWPEAALAGAMDISLGGPRAYQGRRVELPWMGSGRAELTRADIREGLKIYGRALWVFTAMLALGALIL